jgi:hypothetical protein
MSGGARPVPDERELYMAIAAKLTGVSPERVESVLEEHGVTLTSPLPARRELRVRRLYCDGTKEGTTDNDGPFTIDIPLGPGAWAIASKVNSAGKSSLLWALSWALRGESVDEYRRPDTPEWFSYIRADLEVAGVAVSVRLTFDRPNQPSVSLLTADTIDQLLELQGRDDQDPRVRTAATAGPTGVRALIERLMLDRLGLRPISVWSAEKGAPKDDEGFRDSSEKMHSWASYYYAIALNAGHEKILLGPTPTGQLPAKLLQIFLDVPYAPELTLLDTAQKRDNQEFRRVQRRADEDSEARSAQVEPLREALAAAKTRLTSLQGRRPNLTGLLAAVDVAARDLAASRRVELDLRDQLAEARKVRLKDERASRRAHESAAARLLLGALDPEACPRCDHQIDEPRRAAEQFEHRCAVCTRPLPDAAEDPEAQAEAQDRLAIREQASRTAEKEAAQAHTTAEKQVGTSQQLHELAQARLDTARSDGWFTDVETAQREVYQLEGALAVATGVGNALPQAVGRFLATTTDPAANEQPGAADADILAAAADVLRQVVREHSLALFADLNSKVVAIAQRLGVTNLSSVNLTLDGKVNAKKSGKSRAFALFSPGERLRMRIATVIGMITVGRDHGIMSHPGLLLIDAPTAEEVVPGDARVVLQALYDMADQVPGVQIVLTSTEEVLWDVFPGNRIVTGPETRQLF